MKVLFNIAFGVALGAIAGCTCSRTSVPMEDLGTSIARNLSMKTFEEVKITNITNDMTTVRLSWPDVTDGTWFSFVIGMESDVRPNILGGWPDDSPHPRFVGVIEVYEEDKKMRHLLIHQIFDEYGVTFCNWLEAHGLPTGFIIPVDAQNLATLPKAGETYTVSLHLRESPTNSLSLWLHYNERFKPQRK